MQELNFDVNQEYINKKDEKISFPIEIQVNLQQAMNKYVEDHPNLDQYEIIRRAIAGFLMEKGFHNRELTRVFVGRDYFQRDSEN
tara:strand:- start:460 stop:714 length:255 start_codon:yes stop_codon:yes gene_type:complete